QKLNLAQAQARAQREQEHSEALVDSENERQGLFEHPTELISVLQAQRDEEGRVRDWIFRRANRNVLNVLGATRDALVGRSLHDVLGKRAEQVAAACTRALESGEHECVEDRADGRDYRITTFPIGRDRVV